MSGLSAAGNPVFPPLAKACGQRWPLLNGSWLPEHVTRPTSPVLTMLLVTATQILDVILTRARDIWWSRHQTELLQKLSRWLLATQSSRCMYGVCPNKQLCYTITTVLIWLLQESPCCVKMKIRPGCAIALTDF